MVCKGQLYWKYKKWQSREGGDKEFNVMNLELIDFSQSTIVLYVESNYVFKGILSFYNYRINEVRE